MLNLPFAVGFLSAVIYAVADDGNIFDTYLQSLSTNTLFLNSFYLYVKKTMRRSHISMSTFLLAAFYIIQLKTKTKDDVCICQQQHTSCRLGCGHCRSSSSKCAGMNNGHGKRRAEDTHNQCCDNASLLFLKRSRQKCTVTHSKDTQTTLSRREFERELQRDHQFVVCTHISFTPPLSCQQKQQSPSISTCSFMSCQSYVESDLVMTPVVLFLGAVITADKYLNDCSWTNKKWAEFANLSVETVNIYESQFLTSMNWQLTVSPEKFDPFVRRLQMLLLMKRIQWALLPPSFQVDDTLNSSTMTTTVTTILPSFLSTIREGYLCQLSYQDIIVLFEWVGLESMLTVIQWRVAVAVMAATAVFLSAPIWTPFQERMPLVV